MTTITVHKPKQKLFSNGGARQLLPYHAHPYIFSNEARSVHKDGIEYLVAPGVPVQEQVMNTYLLPADEIRSNLSSWDGTPLSIWHPELNGGSVQVPEPDVHLIGEFHNPVWDPSGNRMLGEYWINLTEANKYPEGQAIVNAIRQGNTLETSTAYYADEEMSPGFFKGKPYQTIHRNPKRDHIAIFPYDKLGACSVKDGCGVNRNMQQNCEQCPHQNMTGSLSGSGKALWEKVYKDNKDKGEEPAAKIAWAAVKKAGWQQDKDGKWVKQNQAQFKPGHLPTEMLVGYSMNKGSRSQEELNRIREIIRKKGVTKPVWVQCNGSIKILDGNHRVQLAHELGIEQVPVKVVDSHLMAMDPEAVYRKWLHEQDQEYLQ